MKVLFNFRSLLWFFINGRSLDLLILVLQGLLWWDWRLRLLRSSYSSSWSNVYGFRSYYIELFFQSFLESWDIIIEGERELVNILSAQWLVNVFFKILFLNFILDRLECIAQKFMSCLSICWLPKLLCCDWFSH